MKIYVARQPIYNEYEAVCGYELLHRSSVENSYDPELNGSMATKELVTNVMTEFGLRGLTNDKQAYINFTKELLLSDFPSLLNPKSFIIELLESVSFDERLIKRLEVLKEQRYRFALDDYAGRGVPERVIELVDVIKVDFRLADTCRRREIARKYAGKKLLAEKIETETEFKQSKRDGYSLFQGYYFSKPVMVTKSATGVSNITCMRMWAELSKPSLSYDTLAQIIRTDVNLSYKFLVRINTLQYYRSHRVRSVKAALVRMGLKEIQRWILLLLMREIAGEQVNELVRTALCRGLFAEKMADKMGVPNIKEDAYTVGMFSMIDIIMENDLRSLLQELAVVDSVKEALLERKGILAGILDFVCHYEEGQWDIVTQYIQAYGMDREEVADMYVESVRYADQAFCDTQPLMYQ